MRDKKLLARADLQTAALYFEAACACSRLHDKLGAHALAAYGEHGSLISGCVRDHFPGTVRELLRVIAHDVTRYTDAGYALKPRGVRFTTMRALASAVARRDGGGFYGPRP